MWALLHSSPNQRSKEQGRERTGELMRLSSGFDGSMVSYCLSPGRGERRH